MFETKKILIVDDDSEIRKIASLRLNSAGYEVSAAVDGQDALDKVHALMPDVIVMDLRMPRRDGMSALAELKTRKDTKHIPVVMISASVVDVRRALDAGARFFITKPYKGADLLAAIDTSINELTPATL